jgi:membrane-bound serine protease (ClpP class)
MHSLKALSCLSLVIAGFGMIPENKQKIDPQRVIPSKSQMQALVIPVKGTIDLGLSSFIERALKKTKDISFVIFHINTLGGRVDAAIKIRDLILKSKIPTVAFIDPRAISAGALISLATDIIVMSSGATMGAATPIRFSGGQEPKAVEEKMVSYMRAEMRSTAEAKGRRGDIAEAMVDRHIEIKGIIKKGKLLTLDTSQALKLKFADYKAKSIKELLKKLNIAHTKLRYVQINWAEKVARFFTDPLVSSILMTLGMAGILIELYTPGFGVPGIFGLICLTVFFLGHMVVKLAGWEEALILLLGLTLLFIELFITPGFGILGILGALCVFLSLVMILIEHPPNIPFKIDDIRVAIFRVALSMAITVGIMVILARFLPKTRPGKVLVLKTAASQKEGVITGAIKYKNLEGMIGDTVTDLRPSGKAVIDNQRIDVVSEGEYIPKGQKIKVLKVTGSRIVVRKYKES